jgi:fermentation-respiration switch protein FrsA (DUF1100 family)
MEGKMAKATRYAALAVTAILAASCGGTGSTAAAHTRTHASSSTTTTRTRASGRNGPFAVGLRTETFVDASRPTPAHGNVAAAPTRTLETIIEYPATGTALGADPVEGAKPLSGRFPVIVYVHGFGAHADNPYLRPWAEAGFIAVAPKFPLTNTDTPGGPVITDAVNEPADVSFVVSQLSHLPAADADVQHIIDNRSFAVFGESLGAGVALAIGYNSAVQDPRVRAVAALSGGCNSCTPTPFDPPGTYFTGPSVPLLLVHGTADPALPYAGSQQQYDAAPAPKYFITLVGAQHVQYGPPWEAAVTKASIDFFEASLDHHKHALDELAADANVPGVAELQRDPG